MPRSATLLVLTLALAGCPDDWKTKQDRCNDILQQWESVVAPLSRACGTTDDCTLAGGGAVGPSGSWVGISTYGVALNAEAYVRSKGPELEQEWGTDQCGGAGSDPVCANDVICGDGRCTAVTVHCSGWWDSWDAGVPDAATDAITD